MHHFAAAARPRFRFRHEASRPPDDRRPAKADDDRRKRLLTDALHAALTWVAGELGWAHGPFAEAHLAAINAGLTLAGWVPPRVRWSPNRRVGINFRYEYVGTAVRVWAVAYDRRRAETGRGRLLDAPPTTPVDRLITHVAWVGNGRLNVRSSAYACTSRFVVRLGPPVVATPVR